jgi:hypothetical protein
MELPFPLTVAEAAALSCVRLLIDACRWRGDRSAGGSAPYPDSLIGTGTPEKT